MQLAAMKQVKNHLVSDGRDIGELLQRLSEKWIEEATESGSVFQNSENGERHFGSSLERNYLSPTDINKFHLDSDSLPPQTSEDANVIIRQEQQIRSLHQLQTAILRLHPSKLDLQSNKINFVQRCLLHFQRAKIPTSAPICPTLSSVQESLTSGALSFTVHAASGYDFTAEFQHVYEGHSTSKSTYGDFLVICKRALIAHDPSLSDSAAESYTKVRIKHSHIRCTLLPPLLPVSTIH